MTTRRIGIAGLLLLLALVVVGTRQCMRDHTAGDGDATSPAPATTDDAAARAAAAAAAADAERQRQRQAATLAAMQQVVETVHAYIAALGRPDKAEADAFWSGGRVPERSGEADLRTLATISSLRAENGQPRALDGVGGVPTAFEVPVQLRVGTGEASLRRYEGSFRLRRAVTGDRWEISGADIRASPARP